MELTCAQALSLGFTNALSAPGQAYSSFSSHILSCPISVDSRAGLSPPWCCEAGREKGFTTCRLYVLYPQVIKNRFHRVFLPSHSLDAVSPTDVLLCFELLSPELAKDRVVVLEVQQVSGANLMPQGQERGVWGGGDHSCLPLLSQMTHSSAPRYPAFLSPSAQPASGSSSQKMKN